MGQLTVSADFRTEFIEFAMACGVLRFGEFTLKSGRVSPYFFNAGLFQDGEALARLGGYYAAALTDAGMPCDLLFGPAYKGIPLVSATAIAMAQQFNRSLPYAYNRKEAKDHGEGGVMVGAELKGNVVIVDDVITAGTAIREVMALLADEPVTVSGVVVAIDRQEKGQADLSAIQEVERDYGLSVSSIVKLDDIIGFLRSSGNHESELASVVQYREQYGV